MTLERAAARIGISVSRLSRLERGQSTTPFNGASILEAYGIKPTDHNLERYFPGILARHEERYRRANHGQ